MATVLRVKRRFDEDPVESLLIKCKRHRGAASQNSDGLRFTLVTTVKSKDDVLFRKVLRQEQLKAIYKSHDSSRVERIREERKEISKASRYKIVNCKRSVEDDLVNSTPVSTTETESIVLPDHVGETSDSLQKTSGTISEVQAVVKSDNHDIGKESSLASQPSEHDSGIMEAVLLTHLNHDKTALYSSGSNETGVLPQGVDSAKDERLASVAQGDGSNEVGGAVNSTNDDLDIYDLEQECKEPQSDIQAQQSDSGITLNGEQLISQQIASPIESMQGLEDNFVYDLYYLNSSNNNSQQYNFRDLENILSIEALHDELVYDNDREEECDDIYDDEEDSNDENNSRNTYPDKDPDSPERRSLDSVDDLDLDHVEEPRSYVHYRGEDDDFLSEAMGTRLYLFGSSAEEDNDDYGGGGTDDEGAHQDRGSYYNWYMKQVQKDMQNEDESNGSHNPFDSD